MNQLPLDLVAQPSVRRLAQISAQGFLRGGVLAQLPPREGEPIKQFGRALLLPGGLVFARGLGGLPQRLRALGPLAVGDRGRRRREPRREQEREEGAAHDAMVGAQPPRVKRPASRVPPIRLLSPAASKSRARRSLEDKGPRYWQLKVEFPELQLSKPVRGHSAGLAASGPPSMKSA